MSEFATKAKQGLIKICDALFGPYFV